MKREGAEVALMGGEFCCNRRHHHFDIQGGGLSKRYQCAAIFLSSLRSQVGKSFCYAVAQSVSSSRSVAVFVMV